MSQHKILFSEICRPRNLDELNLSAKDINFLKSMVDDKDNLKNLLFYGKPGVGKTSAALILTKGMDMSAKVLDPRDQATTKETKAFMESYFSSMSFDGNYKTLIINEADKMRKADQNYLIEAIERFHQNGRFILTANDTSKIIDPLKSRLTHLCFDVRQNEVSDVIRRMISRYHSALASHGMSLPPDVVNGIVHIYFPDLRAVANMLEKEVMSLDDEAA